MAEPIDVKQQCDIDHWPHAKFWSWIFMVKFWNSHMSGMGELIDIKQKGCEVVIHDHDLLVTKVKVRWKDLPGSN